MLTPNYELRPFQYLPSKERDIEMFRYYLPDAEDEVEETTETLH